MRVRSDTVGYSGQAATAAGARTDAPCAAALRTLGIMASTVVATAMAAQALNVTAVISYLGKGLG
jgi:uncharacterized membrane protein YraQ (UPF0718 family)